MFKRTPIIILLLAAFSANSQDTNYKNVSAVEFKKLITRQSGTLLDVRTAYEFKNEHIKDAGQLNFYAFNFKRKLMLLSKDQNIYLYCNTGYRSEIAARILAKNGYTRVYNLEKGILDWNINNFATVTEPDAQPDKDNEMSVENYNKLIQSDTLVLIDFYAPWCAPCRKMMPTIDSLKTEYHEIIRIEKINTDASKQLVKTLQLNSVPYFVMFHRGKKLFSHRGLISRKEIEETIQKNTSDAYHK